MQYTLWVCTPSGVRPTTFDTEARRAEQIVPGRHRVSRHSAGRQWQDQANRTYERVRKFAGWLGFAQAVQDDLIVEISEPKAKTVVRQYATVVTDPGWVQPLDVLGEVPVWLRPRWLDDLAIVVCSGGTSARPLEAAERLAHTSGFLWREASRRCGSPERVRIIVHARLRREQNMVVQGLERVLGHNRLPKPETVPRRARGGESALAGFLRRPELDERAVILVADPSDAEYAGEVRTALGRRELAAVQVSPCSKFPGLGRESTRPRPTAIRRAYPRLR